MRVNTDLSISGVPIPHSPPLPSRVVALRFASLLGLLSGVAVVRNWLPAANCFSPSTLSPFLFAVTLSTQSSLLSTDDALLYARFAPRGLVNKT